LKNDDAHRPSRAALPEPAQLKPPLPPPQPQPAQLQPAPPQKRQEPAAAAVAGKKSAGSGGAAPSPLAPAAAVHPKEAAKEARRRGLAEKLKLQEELRVEATALKAEHKAKQEELRVQIRAKEKQQVCVRVGVVWPGFLLWWPFCFCAHLDRLFLFVCVLRFS
jgi:hypothetical protein